MKDDEINLWKRYQAGDKQALEELLIYHIGIVRFWVSQIAPMAFRADRDDLMQEGMIALATAIEKFDLKRGVEFSTYARYWVPSALFKYLRVSRKLSRDQYNNFRKVDKAQETLMRELGRKPTLAEVASRTKLAVRQVELALDAIGIADPQEFIDSDADLPMSSVTVERPQDIILIRELLLRLDERERWVITEYYYLGREDREIAQQRNLTAGNVKTIRLRALKKLRKMLLDESGGKHHED